MVGEEELMGDRWSSKERFERKAVGCIDGERNAVGCKEGNAVGCMERRNTVGCHGRERV
jgi:hypothetical protein